MAQTRTGILNQLSRAPYKAERIWHERKFARVAWLFKISAHSPRGRNPIPTIRRSTNRLSSDTPRSWHPAKAHTSKRQAEGNRAQTLTRQNKEMAQETNQQQNITKKRKARSHRAQAEGGASTRTKASDRPNQYAQTRSERTRNEPSTRQAHRAKGTRGKGNARGHETNNQDKHVAGTTPH